MHDLDLAASDVQDGGDVLVPHNGTEDDLLAEHVEQAIGADEPFTLPLSDRPQASTHREPGMAINDW